MFSFISLALLQLGNEPKNTEYEAKICDVVTDFRTLTMSRVLLDKPVTVQLSI